MTRIKEQTTLDSFCKIQQVSYWRQQLNVANTKNLNNNNSGTRKCYTYGLYQFNNWLKGKKISIYASPHHTRNNQHIKKTTITVKDVGHFLELYQNNQDQKLEFVGIIKRYLLWIREHKSNSITLNALYSIKSFFRENDSEIIFRFNKKTQKNIELPILTIEDLEKILTSKNIQPIEKAVFLCKFQRGLDSSTFADRFNFEAWDQLVEYFGTDSYDKWDLSKCPVPIKLIRVKTNYPHVGFLGIDAVTSIQNYLKNRGALSNKILCKQPMRSSKPDKGEAMFLDTFGNAISVNWIGRRFHKLYSNVIWANSSHSKPKVRCTSHELRDLLKSTLIDEGCRIDVADHILGHAPKDSYEKQTVLYPFTIRKEFNKCSLRINFLSKSIPLYIENHDLYPMDNSTKKPTNYVLLHKQFLSLLDKINTCKDSIAQIEYIMTQINHSFTNERIRGL